MTHLANETGDLGLLLWRERDKHLEDIECGVRGRAMRRRLDEFRCYVDSLAKRYKYAAMEDMRMSEWVGSAETKKQERSRKAANLSELQDVVLGRFGKARVDWQTPAYTTRTCNACKKVKPTSVGAVSHWTCVCGVEHHRDVNAANNLRTNSERWIASGKPPRARKPQMPEKKEEKKSDGLAAENVIEITDTAREPYSEAAE